ncbi:hypothetical protein BpHYR1_026139 [Brachionus plicatilis]|uniref:Uncharacterized protein n=1 Tax=Brachionus plicatilis TaxID=10195 RepID=A0A3M7T7C6_BRAPC|nr:hypothetical protein BpHYR1_026139 [Brachionus plicatilis]
MCHKLCINSRFFLKNACQNKYAIRLQIKKKLKSLQMESFAGKTCAKSAITMRTEFRWSASIKPLLFISFSLALVKFVASWLTMSSRHAS